MVAITGSITGSIMGIMGMIYSFGGLVYRKVSRRVGT